MQFGLDQINKPTPAVLIRLKKAIIYITPVIATIIATIPEEDISAHVKVWIGVAVASATALYQFILILIGEDDSTNQ